MSATPKLSFRANAETVAAIAAVQALLAARRGGKPVSQAGAIDYAVRRAAEDLRAEPEHQLSPDDMLMIQEEVAKAGWPPETIIEAWKDSSSVVVVRRQLGPGRSEAIRLLRVRAVVEPVPPAQQGRRAAGRAGKSSGQG